MNAVALWRWGLFLFFLLGLAFLVGVGVWAVMTIERMKREQTIAITLLRTMAECLPKPGLPKPESKDGM